MPRYFFNFLGGVDSAADEVGCEFGSLDLAYLDAYQSMVRIGADLLLEQKDPSYQRIEITDEVGTILMTLPFDDVFRRRASRRAPPFDNTRLKSQIESSRRLGTDIRAACAEARASVAAARATIGRANESQRLRTHRGW